MRLKKLLLIGFALGLIGCGESEIGFDIEKQMKVDQIAKINDYYKGMIDDSTKSLKGFVQNEAWEQEIVARVEVYPGAASAILPSAELQGEGRIYQTEDGRTIDFEAVVTGSGQEGGAPSAFSNLFNVDIDMEGRLVDEMLFLNFDKFFLEGPDRLGVQDIQLESELSKWYSEPYGDFLKTLGISKLEIEEALNPDSPAKTFSEIMAFLSGATLLESNGPVVVLEESSRPELHVPVRISNKSLQDTSKAFVELLNKIYPMDGDDSEGIKSRLIHYIQEKELRMEGTLYVSEIDPEEGHRVVGQFLKKGEEGTSVLFYFSYNKTPDSYLFLISPETIKSQEPSRFVSIGYEADKKFEIKLSHFGSLKVDLTGNQVSGTFYGMSALINGTGEEQVVERRLGMFSFVEKNKKWNGSITIPGEIVSGDSQSPLKVMVNDFVFSVDEVGGRFEMPLKPLIAGVEMDSDEEDPATVRFELATETKPIELKEVTVPSSSLDLDNLRGAIKSQLEPPTLNDNLPEPTVIE